MDGYKLTQRGKQYLELLPESAFEYETFDLGMDDWVAFTEQMRWAYTEKEIDRLDQFAETFQDSY